MKDFITLLALPASLLCLISSSIVDAHELPWPRDTSNTGQYLPEHEALMKRQWEAQEKLATQIPIGVRKMSGDDGEKFFLHYWDFGEKSNQPIWQDNASTPLPPWPGFVPHSEDHGRSMALLKRTLFARDFKCPGNTHSCIQSIEANICCKPDQTCVSTANGPGCCPSGQTCGDTVGACSNGYTSCNGGCCIAGAVCKPAGCVIYGTLTTTTTLPTVTETSGRTPTTVTGGKTVTVYKPTIIVTTETVTEDPKSGTTKTITVSSGSADSTSNTKVSPPVLPTSVSPNAQSTTSVCWPGYYMCSAHYIGCCKIGRNCDTTSCPPTGTTITTKNGVTIVESAVTPIRGACGSGLHSCPASEQGGCCPTGFRCGTESCTAKGNGGAETAKVEPGAAGVLHLDWHLLAFGVSVGIGMMLL